MKENAKQSKNLKRNIMTEIMAAQKKSRSRIAYMREKGGKYCEDLDKVHDQLKLT